MKYHDNKVYFSLKDGYSLVSGKYTITEFNIPDGQDPDRNIYVGKVTTCGSNGEFNFRIGHDKNKTTATWFNQRIPPSQNTFGHAAGELYFALIGTLELTIGGGVLGSSKKTYTYDSVALALGQYITDNWWFGGKTCSYRGNDQVECRGLNSDGLYHSFTIRRGGNGVDNVDVTPRIVLFDTQNWMKNMPDATTLNNIMMPGSHDAGMSQLHHCAPPIGGDGITKTQSGSVGEQLADGSRYFDIRVDLDYGELVTYHRTGAGLGCNGQPLREVLDQVKNFLSANNKETAILKFSQIREYSGHDPEKTKEDINTLLDDYTSWIYTNANGGVNLGAVTLGSTRGKMILVFDYELYINPSTGRFRYIDGTSATGVNIAVYDKYSETSDYEKMKADQLKKWQDYGGQGRPYFFLLSWTLTAGLTTPPVSTLAAEANSKLPKVLYEQIVEKKWSKPNIVYIDFVSSSVTKNIIGYNF